jgi:oligopeptide transport system substrate-binding protein
MDELPVLPIYTYTRIYMIHPDVQGWDSNLLDNHPYQYLSIRKNIK